AGPRGAQRVPERGVGLGGTGVEQVLALEVEPLAGREALREGERCRPAAERVAELDQLGPKGRIGPGLVPSGLELVERRDQRLGHEPSSVLPVGQLHRAASTYARTRA